MKYWFVTKEIGGRKGAGILNSFMGGAFPLRRGQRSRAERQGNLYYRSSALTLTGLCGSNKGRGGV